ncbi:hypothetical protein N7532_007892 [Penicillium argentinense]|uniref:Zn(2)-C6 fungal-type domain-containing protein n=1 Tax=Penicillium argentinense TaxID=1131581 RepID=A0A9W9EWA5_9EURO|nr:uncharacterized protein N7532_007892 [Penicillium argentinense]KAJ5089208.1 hypothetical protein N7532_007892 [Penicillium argentinense]
MSTNTNTALSRSGGGAPPKLKDSCDMCSSSKIKCNKEKPVCSRCRKLGYPCFYSPARRIGRPHPNRRTTIRKSPEARSCPTRRTTNENLPSTPKDLPPTTRDETFLQSPGSWERDSQNPLHWLDELYLSPMMEEHATSTTAFSEDSCALGGFEAHKLSPVQMQPVMDLDLFNFSDALSSDSSSHWAQLSDADSNILLDMPLALDQSMDQVTSADAFDGNLSCDQTPSSDSSESDCVTSAIEILRGLQKPQKGIEASSDGLDGSGLVTRMQKASSAINRLSTILVCPCSQKTYVAILVASVCLTILDVYDSLFHRETSMAGNACPNANASMGLQGDIEQTDFGEMASLRSSKNEFQCEVSSMQVLEELSKLANVVMQFSCKYKGDSQLQSSSTLSGLAESLKQRLRLVTNEAFQMGYTDSGR